MNSRRTHPRDPRDTSAPRYYSGHDDDFHPKQMGEDARPSQQFGSRTDWHGDWDVDSRENRDQMGAGDDRFGGYTGSHAPGERDRSRLAGGSWDEDRFSQPERNARHRDVQGRSGYGLQGRFGNDWQRGHGEPAHGQYGNGWDGRYERNYGQDFGPSFNSSRLSGDRGSYSSRDDSRAHDAGGGSFAGNRGGYRGQDRVLGYGIPSGSEPGRYGMNDSYQGGNDRNWSGSNWGDDQAWRGRSISSDFGRNQGFGGRAPKGYTRSDERVRDDVCERLYHAQEVDVSDVTVEARNGTITLEGTVPHRAMKHRIEDLCEHCIGVNDVDNRIRVARESHSSAESSSRGAPDDRAGSATGASGSQAAKKSASPGGGTLGGNSH